MGKTVKLSTKKYGNVTLTDADYLAGGGEGEVYVKGGLAYKIYHDPSKMLHIAKINELQVLSGINEIIIPEEVLYNQKGSEVGYVMKYIQDREFLCKLFTKGFRAKNNVTNDDIIELVKYMQKILGIIHTKGIIVGDYNEMNFVLDHTLKIPYHIDTDSWQTPSFKGTAIMPTVMDMTVPMGSFNENTDWYSWAVVVFQLYMGIHPYKGRHPSYNAKDFEKRVKDKVSVFNNDVEIPATAQDFSVIPKMHLDWFKEVFEKGHRGVPPVLGAVNAFVSHVAKVINATDIFIIDDYFTNSDKITKIFNFKEVLYVLSKDKMTEFSTKKEHSHPNLVALCEVLNKDPILVIKNNKTLVFKELDGREVGSIEYERGFFLNGACYTVNNGLLVENFFKEYRKVQHLTRICDNINPLSYQVFDGFVLNDIVGSMYLSIPYVLGTCASIKIPELDGRRIIDGKYMNKIAILITELFGKYDRVIINFNDSHDKYDIQIDSDVDIHDVNFTVLPNGIAMNIFSDERVELFQRISTQVKQITNPPFNATNTLYQHMGKIIYVDGNLIKKTTMKKP